MDALLQLGDSHWYGRGVNRSWPAAAQLYQAASKFSNAQALFNLGIMHEYGAGLPQVPTAAPPIPSDQFIHWGASLQCASPEVQRAQSLTLGASAVVPKTDARERGYLQDLHLAKRYYDKSLAAQKEAHVPVRLALIALAVHGW